MKKKEGLDETAYIAVAKGNCANMYYFSTKTYIVILIRSALVRHYCWVPTMHAFVEK